MARVCRQYEGTPKYPILILIALCLLQDCLGVAVHRLRVNAQSPDWFGSCPPQRLPNAKQCTNGLEILGIPTTDLRLSWEIMAGTWPKPKPSTLNPKNPKR